jgi:hypothetical protein
MTQEYMSKLFDTIRKVEIHEMGLPSLVVVRLETVNHMLSYCLGFCIPSVATWFPGLPEAKVSALCE